MDRNKMISPWLNYTNEDIPDLIIFVRWLIERESDRGYAAWVSFDPKTHSYCGVLNSFPTVREFHSIEEGQKLLDKELIEEGFVFLTEEQWDKYSLLI